MRQMIILTRMSSRQGQPREPPGSSEGGQFKPKPAPDTPKGAEKITLGGKSPDAKPQPLDEEDKSHDRDRQRRVKSSRPRNLNKAKWLVQRNWVGFIVTITIVAAHPVADVTPVSVPAWSVWVWLSVVIMVFLLWFLRWPFLPWDEPDTNNSE